MLTNTVLVRNLNADEYSIKSKCLWMRYEMKILTKTIGNVHYFNTARKWTCCRIQFEIRMLTNTAWNEHADVYNMKWTCWRIQFEIRVLMNTAWNEHADEYNMKWTCWRIQFEIRMLMNTEWNEHADEYSMKWTCCRIQFEIRMLMNTALNEHADEYGLELECAFVLGLICKAMYLSRSVLKKVKIAVSFTRVRMGTFNLGTLEKRIHLDPHLNSSRVMKSYAYRTWKAVGSLIFIFFSPKDVDLMY